MDRRTVVKGLALAGLAPPVGLLTGCSVPRITAPDPVVRDIVDAHSHIFNVSDVPALGFISQVVFEFPLKSVVVPSAAMRASSPVDPLIELVLWIFGSQDAESAQAELDALEGRTLQAARAPDARLGESAVEDSVVDILLARPAPRAALRSDRPLPPRPGPAAQQLLLDAARQSSLSAPQEVTDEESARAVARAATESRTTVGLYLRWLQLFPLPRRALLDRLVDLHVNDGFRPELVTPAILDLSKWVDEPLDRGSRLEAQVRVMGAISLRYERTAVHGYAAFDPLRQVYHDQGLASGDPDPSPMRILRIATEECGFLGAKLYPPMGFLPLGNRGGGEYPAHAVAAIGEDRFGTRLDAALTRFYDRCRTKDIPILAHATATQGATRIYRERAEPKHWKAVLHKREGLRLQLAHFGGFDRPRNLDDAPAPPFGDSEEWGFGEVLRMPGTENVVADISFFSELLIDKPTLRRGAIAERFKAWLGEFDEECRHLVFGSDWSMLGKEPNHERNGRIVQDFLLSDCRLSVDQVRRIFRDNALRYAGLVAGQPTFERIVEFRARASNAVAPLPYLTPEEAAA